MEYRRNLYCEGRWERNSDGLISQKEKGVTLLLKDPDLNIELRTLFIDHLRQISGLQAVPHPAGSIIDYTEGEME